MKNNYSSARKPSFGDRKSSGSFGGRSGSRPSFGDRGDRKPFGDRGGFKSDKPSFGDRGGFKSDRPSFGSRVGFKSDRPSFGDRGGFKSDRPSFGDRGGFKSDRPSFGDRGDRKPFGDRGGFKSDRPSFGSRVGFKSDRPSFGDRGGFKSDKPAYEKRDRNESFPEKAPYRAQRDFSRDFEKSYSKSDERIAKMKDSMNYAQGSDDTLRPQKQRSYMRTTPQSTSAQAVTSWGEVASWYDEHLENDEDTYHRQVILPNLTRLISTSGNEKVLEIACGQGFFARRFQKEFQNASFEGIDIGEDLIKIAEKRSPNMKFSVGNAEDLSQYEDNSFDTVYIVLAIQNIEHIDKLIDEVSRILKTDGHFHIVMNHPVLRIPKETSWEYVDAKEIQARRVDAYLSEAKTEMDMHPSLFNSPKTLSFHRPLQTYFKFLAKHNLLVDRLEEWISHKTSDSGPRAKAENKARKEFPMFMYLRTIKK